MIRQAKEQDIPILEEILLDAVNWLQKSDFPINGLPQASNGPIYPNPIILEISILRTIKRHQLLVWP